MSPEKVIDVAEFFRLFSLATRQAARNLFQEINALPEHSIILDFKAIVSVSRSFLDELNNFFQSSEKDIRLFNLNDDLQHLLQIVRETAENKDRVTYDSLADAELITL
jgi:anti-anti-sigma regulatory factor